MTRRRPLDALLPILLVLVLVLGCRREPTAELAPYDPAGDPQVNPSSLFEAAPADRNAIATEDVLVRRLEAEPNTLNPLFHSTAYDTMLIAALFDGLFEIDRTLTWKVNDAIVESWEMSDDRRAWTFRLREGLQWHDGAPFTAADVVFTWEAIVTPDVPALAIQSRTGALEKVAMLDERTVQFVHKESLATNQWNMVFPIVPKHILGNEEERRKDPTLQKSDYYQRYGYETAVGNGPYRLVRWVRNQEIVLERWEDFHGRKPCFKRQVLKIIKDSNQALNLLKKGELDEMQLQPIQFATQTNDEEFARVAVKAFAPTWSYLYIGWNLDGSNPFFADRNVRRAMAHAADIPRMLRTFCYGLFEPARGIFHPSSWAYNPELELIQCDLDEAARLLDEAGWAVDPSDGRRYKEVEGRRVPFEFTLLIPQGSEIAPPAAEVLRQDLARIGVTLRQEVSEFGALRARVEAHDFQAYFMGWATGTDPDMTRNIWHSSEHAGGRNYVGYRNARVDELYELGRRELDAETRTLHYREMQKLIYDDQPYLFLFNIPAGWAFHKRLRGVEFSPRGVFNFRPSVLAWWVPVAERLR